MKKRGLAALILLFILIILTVLLGWLVFHFYLDTPNEIIEIPSPEISTQSCNDVQDDYILPDFAALKTKLSSEEMVKSTPENAKIILMFYHFVGDCRIWDKTYLLRDGKIEEKNIVSDVKITLDSSYVDDLMEDSLCNVAQEARISGDLGQESTLTTTQLLWEYKSMVEYRECLGV